MHKSLFRFTPVLFAFVISLFGTQCWAQACGDESNCTTFSPGNTSFTYDFGEDGALVVEFESILTNFDLRVSLHTPKPVDSSFICVEGPCAPPIVLDPKEFPAGTLCVNYGTSNSGECDQYDFTGNAAGPHGVPVKNKNYKGLITLTLRYATLDTQPVHIPAFGHAPGDTIPFTEDILAAYSSSPTFSDPTMRGKTPSLSSVVALDEPFSAGAGHFCGFETAPVEGNSLQEGEEVEIAFRLSAPDGNCTPPAGIRDKTAKFTVWTTQSGNVVFTTLVTKEEGGKFHWDAKNGINELDISTDGLAPGSYNVTVTSSFFPPHDTSFTVN